MSGFPGDRMKFKTWGFGFLALAVMSPLGVEAQQAQPTPLTINESQAPIRVDGHLNDWPSARMLVLDQSSQVVLGKAFWKGSDDFNGKVFITYDALYLYAAVIVEKKGPAVNSNEKLSLWNGDCLEIFLSTGANKGESAGLSSGDYHLGFSPGGDCKNPFMYCFNKNKEIVGGRVIARTTKTGYLLEASVPLSFFAGLSLGPGKTAGFNVALDEGGQVSGNRLLQLDYSRDPLSREHPSAWAKIQWAGKAEALVPENHEEDLYAGAVKDGTKGATYSGIRKISGKVLDQDGKPLAGARVSTWPKTEEVLTDQAGAFELAKIKTYDKTLIYAKSNGYRLALAGIPAKGKAVTLVSRGMPPFPAPGAEGSFVSGLSLRLSPSGKWEDLPAGFREKAGSLRLKYLRLCGTESIPGSPGMEHLVLDQFVAFARGMGAEPILEVPLGEGTVERAADWVRYCNLEKKYNLLYWTIGDEPDASGGLAGAKIPSDYSAYDYINDFRSVYNAMKGIDPSLLVLGPELAWKYTDGENDWLTPFIRYNGDIVDAISVHRYASLTSAECDAKKLWADLRGEDAILRNLRDKISGNTDLPIPLVVTGGNTCRESKASPPNQDEGGPGGFWAGLWIAEKAEIDLKEGLGLRLFSYLRGGEGLDILTESGTPACWALSLLAAIPAGKLIPAQINRDEISVCAIQDEKTKDLTLLLVNKGDRYFHPKIRLDGKESDLAVEAGLRQKVDFEIPAYSIACLKIKADNSPGQASLYTVKMFQAGKGPAAAELKPW